MGKGSQRPRTLGTGNRSAKKSISPKRWPSILRWQRGVTPTRKSEVVPAIIGVLGFIFVIWMVVMFS